MNNVSSHSKIITFYSYKGGTGRSMALANIAWILAAKGNRVLILDWDLEAPGLHRYFRPFLIDKELTFSDGIIDFLIAYADAAIAQSPEDSEPAPQDWYVRHADITDYALSLNFEEFPKGGKIDFVPAGRQGPTYAARVNTFDWVKFYNRLGGGTFLEAAKAHMRSKYDYILIDSRTGISDSSGICTIQMPDTLVVCFTYNNQSIEGAAAVANSAWERHREYRLMSPQCERQSSDYLRDHEALRILPVPMRAEQSEKIKLDHRKKYARRRFNRFVSHIPPSRRDAYWGAVEVPYVPFYAFEEMLSPFIDNATDVTSVLGAMLRITYYLTDAKLKDFDLVISTPNKDKVLREFAAAPDILGDVGLPAGADDEALRRLIREADEIYMLLTPDEQDGVRRLWTRLVRIPRPGEGETYSRLVVKLNELEETERRLARKLADEQLLVIERISATGEPAVQVANEELLRRWGMLQSWIESDKEFLLWRQQLHANVAEWEGQGRHPSSLLKWLYVSEAEKKLKQRAADFSAGEREYIKHSIIRRRKNYVVAGTVLAIIILILLRGINFWREREQREQLAARLVQAVKSFSVNDRQADPELGALLAIESLRILNDDGAKSFLQDYLAKDPLPMAELQHEAEVDSVIFSADGSQLTTVSGNFDTLIKQSSTNPSKMVWVWDFHEKKTINRQTLDPGIQGFAVSADGRFVAIVYENISDEPFDSVSLLDLKTHGRQTPTKVVTHEDKINDLIFSREGSTLLATASEDRTAKVVDVLKQRQLIERPLIHSSQVTSVAFGAPDQLVTGEENAVNVWDLTRPSTPIEKKAVEGYVFAVAQSPNGKHVAAMVLGRQRTKGQPAQEGWLWTLPGDSIRLPIDGGVNDMAFSPDSSCLAVAGKGGEGLIFSVMGGQPKTTISHGAVINKMIFTLNGKYVATVGQSQFARIWEVETGREFLRLNLKSNVNDIAFSSDGRYAAVAGKDKTVRIWEMGEGKHTVGDISSETCARLSRNLTPMEWAQYLGELPYHKTCANLP